MIRANGLGYLLIALSVLACEGTSGTETDVAAPPAADIRDTGLGPVTDIVNPASCPETMTLAMLWRGEWEYIAQDCNAGTVCQYPAEGCAPGEKAPNVCRCSRDHSVVCDQPWQHCLDQPGPGWQPGDPERPAPESRSTEACADPSPVDPNDVCESFPMSPDHDGSSCETNGDCPEEAPLCLAAHEFGSWHICECHPVDCLTDDDCAEGEACRCGEIDNTGQNQEACGGWRASSCSHRCLPAECRTDADCGPHGVCSPSLDFCGWEVVGYYCHDPTLDECFSRDECRDVEDPSGWTSPCSWVDGAGWRCRPVPACD